MITKICPKCGREGEGKFCSKCGGRLTTVNRCPQCKREMGIGDKFCSDCGAELGEPKVRIPQTRATLHL